MLKMQKHPKSLKGSPYQWYGEASNMSTLSLSVVFILLRESKAM